MRQRRTAWWVFLGALALLVLNDFWFKSAGFVPTWVTGKLSDVAGLIVAPVTLALLLKRQLEWLYRAGFALIALIFAAVEVSPLCSEILLRALSLVGLSWSLWPDPTDLWALLVLPIAWQVSSILARVAPRDRSRLMVFPAAAACLASGNVPTELDAGMVVYNGTDQMIVLNVASVPWLACSDLVQLGADLLETGDFGARELVRLAPAAAYPLVQSDCGCGLYRLTAGGRSTVVLVPEGAVKIDRHPSVEQRRRHQDRMLVIADDFSFAAGKAIQTLQVADEAKTGSCGTEPPALAYTTPWNGQLPYVVAGMEVLAVEPIAGNCFGVKVQRASLVPAPPATAGEAGAGGAPGGGVAGAAAENDAGAAGGGGAGEPGLGPMQPVPAEPAPAEPVPAEPVPVEPERLYLCAPIELFPFAAGDVVDIDRSNADGSDTFTLRTADRRFTLRIGKHPGSSYVIEPRGCGPMRDEAGGPWQTVPVKVGPTQTLVPGRVSSFVEAGGRLDVYLGRTRRFYGCAPPTSDGEPGTLSVEIAESWSL